MFQDVDLKTANLRCKMRAKEKKSERKEVEAAVRVLSRFVCFRYITVHFSLQKHNPHELPVPFKKLHVN